MLKKSKNSMMESPLPWWLFGTAGLVATTLTVGAAARLTRSGGSTLYWKPHFLHPKTKTEWHDEFDVYCDFCVRCQRIPMTLEEFKRNYKWESAHRMLGQLTALSFVGPLAYFAMKRKLPISAQAPLALIAGLGATQLYIGREMVSSNVKPRRKNGGRDHEPMFEGATFFLPVHHDIRWFARGGDRWRARVSNIPQDGQSLDPLRAVRAEARPPPAGTDHVGGLHDGFLQGAQTWHLDESPGGRQARDNAGLCSYWRPSTGSLCGYSSVESSLTNSLCQFAGLHGCNDVGERGADAAGDGAPGRRDAGARIFAVGTALASLCAPKRVAGRCRRHRSLQGHTLDALKDSSKSHVKVCCAVGFPLGAATTATKAFEAQQCLDAGAEEIDMVINVGMLHAEEYDFVLRDICAVVAVCKERGAVSKVILETALLSTEQIRKASELAIAAGADFIKTSTGFSTRGASEEDVKLMASIAKPAGKQVKASGGIRSAADAEKMIALGATRLGTSAGVKIAQGQQSSDAY
ncbi:hypothetical protein ON010_g3675 [Phytophthora cinnamomi]|nr:hypothetical protein ON010_g3675 [Phytophthora cinnamomi]